MSVQSKAVPVKLTPLGMALAGALGGCFSTAVVYPLDVAKTQIQASKGKSKADLSMLAVLIRILKKEGIFGWYRGFWATMINTFSMQYAYFFFYSMVRTSYIRHLTRKIPAGSKVPALSTAAELLLGAAAGALAQIFTIPVSVIATRQQVGRTSKEGESKPQDDSFFGVAREIIDEEGVGGLWLGIKPGLVLTVNPAITYGVFERIKSLVIAGQAKAGGTEKLAAGSSFLIGAMSKTLATVVTYPYIMAKVRIQTRSADEDEAAQAHLPAPSSHHAHHDHSQLKHPGALDILGQVLRKEGFVGWYRGMSAQIIKAVLSQALLFMSKEQFEQWALRIIIIFARLR
ncbi:unnamed protein product [Mycena citricolor]|uniref:Mitochondrial carrier n=1 Tax=Mycena citricolor TaxID=2018698 RepID=A0AAD2JYR8_9AGAR|nr:unnamed protein product [Mycena citricolor]